MVILSSLEPFSVLHIPQTSPTVSGCLLKMLALAAREGPYMMSSIYIYPTEILLSTPYVG